MNSQITSTETGKLEFLTTADRIGAQLCRDAIWAGPRCNWLGDSMEQVGKDWKVVHRALGPDFYGGTSGVALFLGRLFASTGARLFQKPAVAAVRQAISPAAVLGGPATIGFYSGLTGIAYTLAALSQIFQSEELAQKGKRILKALAGQAPQPLALDVISGSAGAVPALLSIRGLLGEDSLLDLAVRHGENLLATATETSFGISWNTLNIPAAERRQDLTGFSHGTAGIAWALLELFAATGEGRFCDAAERG